MFTCKPAFILCALFFLLAGCSQPGPAPIGTSVSTPKSGKSGLVGQVVSKTNQAPIMRTIVRLATVYHDKKTNQAVFALDLARSPGTYTDDKGSFAFTDLDPGEYVLAVGDYYGQNDIVHEKNGDARVFKTELGKVLNAGIVQVRPDVSPGR